MMTPVPAATVHERGPRIVVTGEVDAFSAPRITEVVDLRLADGEATVRLDLRDTTFCDSAGLVTLLDCRAAAAAAGGRLVLVAPSETVVRLLELAGLTELFDTEAG
jgi:anti-sigma B factor antagonist